MRVHYNIINIIIWLTIFIMCQPSAAFSQNSTTVVSQAGQSGFIEQKMRVPVEIPSSSGLLNLTLEALLVRPPAAGPFPLAVLNHGMGIKNIGLKGDMRAAMSPRTTPVVELFVQHGWAVLVLMRRGYGHSEGSFAEGPIPCNSIAFANIGREAAKDIAAAMSYMKTQPYINGNKMISVGISGGGFASVALGSESIDGLSAIINFAGGRGCHENDISSLPGAMHIFGQTSKVPSLWIYAENDHIFGPDLAKSMYRSFTAAGGRADFVDIPPFGPEGHNLLSKAAIPLWNQIVFEFLRRHNL